MQYFSNFINPFDLDQKDKLFCLSQPMTTKILK